MISGQQVFFFWQPGGQDIFSSPICSAGYFFLSSFLCRIFFSSKKCRVYIYRMYYIYIVVIAVIVLIWSCKAL